MGYYGGGGNGSGDHDIDQIPRWRFEGEEAILMRQKSLFWQIQQMNER